MASLTASPHPSPRMLLVWSGTPLSRIASSAVLGAPGQSWALLDGSWTLLGHLLCGCGSTVVSTCVCIGFTFPVSLIVDSSLLISSFLFFSLFVLSFALFRSSAQGRTTTPQDHKVGGWWGIPKSIQTIPWTGEGVADGASYVLHRNQ